MKYVYVVLYDYLDEYLEDGKYAGVFSSKKKAIKFIEETYELEEYKLEKQEGCILNYKNITSERYYFTDRIYIKKIELK